jgi:uncharacterized protein YecE (DUF72 family)
MATLPLFEDDALPPQAARLAPRLRALADEGVYFGTSSWKYDGWLGSIYSPERYLTRGKHSKAKFEAECVGEYARTFPVVCGDFAFYQFPSDDYWRRLFEGSPESLRFSFKVPEDITVAKWPTHARYEKRGGQENAHFLNADVFDHLFVRPLAPYSKRVAPLIFEFGTFSKAMFPTVEHFVARLQPFLAALPDGPRYAIEIRIKEYLVPAYFSTLASHNVAHVFNAWTRMPELGRQIEMPGAYTADFAVVRALLAHGRSYEDAVKTFEPYQSVQSPNVPAREAMCRIMQWARGQRKDAFIFVNNRLEGNAPSTIEAVVGE